jgi:hypothetical protein
MTKEAELSRHFIELFLRDVVSFDACFQGYVDRSRQHAGESLVGRKRRGSTGEHKAKIFTQLRGLGPSSVAGLESALHLALECS